MYELAQHEISEKIYDGDTSIIYRAKNCVTGKSVILKFLKNNYPENELLQDFTQEYSITASFQSEQIVKAYSLDQYQKSLVMVLEDCGTITLSSIIRKVKKSIGWALDVAVQLTETLIVMHQQDVVHQDLNPTNILYNNEKHTIKIIDFGEARIGHGVTFPSIKNDIVSTTFPYISAEQTGRYNKVLDYQTDLYSLGITLYELFTGTPPFIAADPMELIHFHLATSPKPPSIIDPTIPETLSKLILKLIRKSRKSRYQTCTGLLADLHRCRKEWQTHHTISKFPLGKNDFPDELIFPDKLFNRKNELSILHDAIKEKKEAPPLVIVIRGTSGIGKTSLVYEFKNSLLPYSYHFLVGKCNLATLNKPYVVLAEVLQALVNSVLVKSKESVQEWKTEIINILKENGQILVDLVPELELIIGKQLFSPDLNPYETEQRLSHLCSAFIQLFASKSKPLIIFLDDIHRADLATLKIIQHLATSKILKNVSFIFCFRENEVNNSHPLNATLNAIQKTANDLKNLQLSPLKRRDVTELLAIMLSQPEEKVAEMAEICFKKTGGNPFSLKQFIHSLNRKGYLKFHPQKGRFDWDILVAKVDHLYQQKFDQASEAGHQAVSQEIIPRPFRSKTRESGLDMMTVMKASRILVEETTFHELLKKIMQIFLESSGAQRGFLILNEKNRWCIKIAGSTNKKNMDLLHNIDIDSQNRASSAIINYVIRTRRDLILNDATREDMFTDDKYIIANSPRSILCMPLIHQNEMVCVLYLENNLTTRVFSLEKQELLHLLGNQAAINIRNSRLFGKLKESITEFHLEIKKRKKVQLQLLHSEKLSALGRLSSSIAHEFGNPLMGIKYLLSDFIERPDLKEEDKNLLLMGLEECNRMKRLLKNLGQLNRPSTGKKNLANIQKIMDNVLFFQEKYLKSQRLQIVKNYTKNLPDIIIIQDQISQVLLNLTINAVDSLQNHDGIITITTWETEENVFLSLADTGKGIDPDIQGNIFEPFFSTKNAEDGTGLGLSTSYGIIRQHKGQLTFVSEPGTGTVFTLSLPRI